MYQGGEVTIKFSKRISQGKEVVIPIVTSYPKNQYICEEVDIEIED